MKRLYKISIWVLTIIVFITILAGVFTQTSIFRSWLKDLAVAEANGVLQGEVSIEKIDGNLINVLSIHNMVLLNNRDTLLTIHRLDIAYDLLALFAKKIEVSHLIITDPIAKLYQDSAGVWNIKHIVSNNSPEDTLSSENSHPFGFSIRLDSLSIINGNISVDAVQEILPKTISDLNLNLMATYCSGEFRVNLNNLSFRTERPDFILKKFSFNFLQNEEGVSLKNLSIITGLNKIESEGNYHESRNNYLNLTSEKLDLQEFAFIFPDIYLRNYPNLTITSYYNQDSISFKILLESEGERLSIMGQGVNYIALLEENNGKKLDFTIDVILDNLQLQNWSNAFPRTNLSGVFQIMGQYAGSGLNDFDANVTAELKDAAIDDYLLDLLQLEANYEDDNLNGHIFLYSKYADVNLGININNLTNSPHYDGSVSVSGLDINKILSSDSFKSDLNFDLSFQGVNFVPPDNFASFELDWSPSRINQLKIDTLSSAIQLSGSRYNFERFRIKTLAGLLSLSGGGDLNSTHRINYFFKPDDLQNIATLVQADSLFAKGNISGVITGKTDSWNNELFVDLQQVKFNQIYIDSLVGKANFNILDSLIAITSHMNLHKINVNEILLDKVETASIYDGNQLSSDIDIRFDSLLAMNLSTLVSFDNNLNIVLPRIDLQVLKEHWQGGLKKLTYDTAEKDIQISDLNMRCLTSEDKRSVNAKGMLSLSGSQDFHLNIEGLHPKTIISYLGIYNELDGRVNFNLDIGGTATNPLFEGEIKFEEGYIGTIKYQGIHSWFDYKDDRFRFNFGLDFNGEDSLRAKGDLPFHFSLTDTMDIFDPEALYDLQVKSDEIPIGLLLSNIKVLPELSGTLLCDLSFSNTFIDPVIRGDLQLNNGIFRSPYWGIDYKDIDLNISAHDDRFLLDVFQINSTEGSLDASGEIQLEYGIEKDKVIYSNLKLRAENFTLVQHKDFDVQISSDIKYQMEQGKPRVSGFIDINKSSFYLPTVMKRAGYVTSGENKIKPALIKARDRKLGKIDFSEEVTIIKSETDSLNAPEFLDILEGELEIRLERNTWIRNPQLRLELGGNLKMTMNKGEFFLEGPVEIVRGQYDLFGRRFIVQHGKVEFLGTDNMNPPINLEAEYVYRTVGREKRFLLLKVSGNMEFPRIDFYDMNDKITQDDAISIILYGRKRDELSFGTQNDVGQNAGVNTAAMGLVSNMVSDRLTRSFGDDLKLDVIEVNATDNWQSANFVVGKYLTDDIFVTYKREFGQNLDNNLYPETISMEYEIQRYIFLQLIQGSPQISGYDLLFRVDWD